MGAYRPLETNQSFRLDLSAKGYVVLFRPDEINHCPGCGHSQWFIGRISAECGICGTALPLASESQQSPVSGASRKAVALHVLPEDAKRATGDERRSEPRLPARGKTLDAEPAFGPSGGLYENPGYAVVDLGGSYHVVRGVEVFARVMNLFDRAYEEALGFPLPGRTAFAGVRVAAGR